jgi:hypothetical protein
VSVLRHHLAQEVMNTYDSAARTRWGGIAFDSGETQVIVEMSVEEPIEPELLI